MGGLLTVIHFLGKCVLWVLLGLQGWANTEAARGYQLAAGSVVFGGLMWIAYLLLRWKLPPQLLRVFGMQTNAKKEPIDKKLVLVVIVLATLAGTFALEALRKSLG